MRHALWPALYLVAAFAATLWLFGNAMDHRGADDLRHALSNLSPYHWPMESGNELSNHGRNDIGELELHDGAFRFSATGNDPHFWLNGRRLLDLRGYPKLSLAIHSQHQDRLQIHLSCATHPQFVATHAIDEIDLKPGINQLVIRVDEPNRHSLTGAPCPNHAFDSLRIDPGKILGNRFILDDVGLQPIASSSALTPPQRMSYHQVETLKSLPHFTQTGRHLIIENVAALASPEWNRARADRLYRQNPSAILFSGEMPTRLEGVIDGSRSPQPRQPPRRGGLGWLSSFLLLGMAATTLVVFGGWLKKRIVGHKQMIIRRLLERPRIQLALVVTASLLAFQTVPYAVISPTLLIIDALAFLTLLVLLLIRGAPPVLPPGAWSWFGKRVGAWRDTAFWTFLLAGSLLILAIFAPPNAWPDPGSLALHAARYTLWALLQQLILGPLLIDRLYAIHGDKWKSIVIGAMIFSAFHFPNFALMCVTLVAGLIWARLYLRYHALLPLALSHGFLGSLFEHLLPEYLRWSGKIGVGYFQAMGF